MNRPGITLLRALYLVLLPLVFVPRPLGLVLARVTARAVHPFARSLRRIVRGNLECFEGRRWGEQEARTRTLAVFRAYGRFILDLFLAYRGGGPRVTVVGMQHLASLRERGEGVILVTTHTGNWERGLYALPAEHPGVDVVTAAGSFPLLEKLRTMLRLRHGMKEQLGGSTFDSIALLHQLRAGRWVALQGDRAPTGRGRWSPFGAGEAFLPHGVERLAELAPAVLLPVSTHYLDDRRLELVIDPPIFPDDDSGPILGRLHRRLEAAVARAPDQWLMMVPNVRPRSAADRRDRVGESSPVSRLQYHDK